MIKLGLVMVLASVLGSFVKNFLNIFITNYGSVADLGFYNAGHTIALSYVGMIFTAMSYEYFPRLSRISEDNKKVSEAVNQQSEMIFLILLPILIMLICFTEFIIELMLTSEFYVIIKFIRILSFSILINAAAFTISYIPIAKGDKKVFYVQFISSCIAAITFSSLGYYFGKLNGLAVGICIVSIIHFSFMLIVCKNLYEFNLSKKFISFFFINFISISIAFILSNLESPFKYFNILVLIFSFWYSINNLNKLLDIVGILNNFRSKFLKKYLYMIFGSNNLINRQKWVEKTLKAIPKNKKIIDVGAGECQYKVYCDHLNYISQDFNQYTGDEMERDIRLGNGMLVR